MDEVNLRGVEIVRAKPRDAEALTRISFTAKRYWGYPERWSEIWKAALTITPEFVHENGVCVAVVEGEAKGFYAITGTGDVLELEHLWVRPGWIRSGIGRALFDHAVANAASMGASAVKIEADPNAEGFYLRMGARRTGENFYDLEGQKRTLPVLTMKFKFDGCPQWRAA